MLAKKMLKYQIKKSISLWTSVILWWKNVSYPKSGKDNTIWRHKSKYWNIKISLVIVLAV